MAVPPRLLAGFSGGGYSLFVAVEDEAPGTHADLAGGVRSRAVTVFG